MASAAILIHIFNPQTMEIIFPKGFKFTWGELEFEKLEDNGFSLWVATNSNYTVLVGEDKHDVDSYKVLPEEGKPLYDKNGKLNRFGFRWTDKQIRSYYNLYEKNTPSGIVSNAYGFLRTKS